MIFSSFFSSKKKHGLWVDPGPSAESGGWGQACQRCRWHCPRLRHGRVSCLRSGGSWVELQRMGPEKFLVGGLCGLSILGMDQYLLIAFLVGWTSMNPSYDLGFTRYQGFDTLPNLRNSILHGKHMDTLWNTCWQILWNWLELGGTHVQTQMLLRLPGTGLPMMDTRRPSCCGQHRNRRRNMFNTHPYLTDPNGFSTTKNHH